MSNIRYEASPSMVRTNPLGSVLMILLILLGIALAFAGGTVAAALGIPAENAKVIGIVGIVLVVVGFVRLLFWWIATKLDRLVIKDDEIVWTHGLLNKQYTEINMASVRTVRVSQSLLQRIMDAGDITIFTSGDVPELVVKGLPKPGAIRDYIKSEA